MLSILDNASQKTAAFSEAGGISQALLEHLDRIVTQSLIEDVGPGDVTSLCLVPSERTSTAHLYIKESAMIAGLSIFAQVMKKLDPSFEFEPLVKEATYVSQVPCLVAEMKGSSRALLAGERTALNLIQRLSGIATITAQFVELAKPHGISILDTRKTIPGLRALEKWAVAAAGGDNHRFGLYDQILIKDNHLRIAGGVTEAVQRARAFKPDMPIEVEVSNLDELQEALALKVERIMLDNMSPEQVRQSVKVVNEAAFVEVSGGINLSNITSYLIPGVNAISIGALTHSAKNVDISLEIED